MFSGAKWAAGVGVLLAAGTSAQAAAVKPVPVFVNGGRLASDAFMLQGVGRTVLPMRVLFENLGARVEWDRSQQAVYAWMPDAVGVRLGLGEKFAQTMRMSAQPGRGNWGAVTGTQRLDAPAMLVNGRVFVPLRFASEALHADVRYSADRPAVHIHTQAVAAEPNDERPAARVPREPEVDPDPPVVRRPRRPDVDTEPRVSRRPRPRVPDVDVEPPVARRPRVRDGNMTPAEIAEALSVSLIVDDEAGNRDGERTIRLLLRNTSERSLVVPFRSGQKFDIQIIEDGNVLWNWSHDRACTQALTSLSMKPGEEVTFTARWNTEDNRGRQVRPGRYTVRGILTTAFQEPQLVAEDRVVVRE